MALSTNAAIQNFDGTGIQTAISASGGSQDLAAGAYSPASGATHTVIDNSTTLAPMARVILVPGDGWTGSVTSGQGISVFVIPQDIDSTNDAPDISAAYGGHFSGVIPISTNEPTNPDQCLVNLMGVRKFQIQIKNDTSAALDDDNTNGWQVKVELLSVVPKS